MNEDIAFVVAGSSIACLALGLWLAPQRHRVGLALGVLGLAGISFATVWRTYLSPHVVSLKAQISRLNDELTSKTREGQVLMEKVQGQDAHIATLNRETSLLTEKIDRLETQRAKAKAARLDGLRQMMQYGLSTPTYHLQAMSETELVSGLKGSYFSIRLRESATGSLFIFREREFALDDSLSALRESTGRVRADLVNELTAAQRLECFVRGGADVRPFKDVQPASRPESTSYLPLGDDGKYATQSRDQFPSSTISNDDLPNLRAAYIQSIIAPILPCNSIAILGNGPAATPDPTARTVEIILYVIW